MRLPNAAAKKCMVVYAAREGNNKWRERITGEKGGGKKYYSRQEAKTRELGRKS